MIRVPFVLILVSAAVLAQQVTPPAPATVPNPQAVSPQLPGRAELPEDAPVITVHGVCATAARGGSTSSAPCVTAITKDQFETIVSAMTFNTPGQALTPATMRIFAENYVQSLTLADAAARAGVDQDPRFHELMNIMRLRLLADAYRHSLQEKYGNPSAQEVEAEYNSNPARFDQVTLDRIFIPKFNPKSPREDRAEFEKKARQVADEIRARAAKGEDFNKLHADAYKLLGLIPPLTTDIGARRLTGLPPEVQQEIAALKPGEVSQVGSQAAGFTVYKVRNREPLPLQQVKGEIVREISRKKMDEALKAAQARVHAVLEEQFFGPKGPQLPPPAAKTGRVP